MLCLRLMYFRIALPLVLAALFGAGAGIYVAYYDDGLPINHRISIVLGALVCGSVGFATGLMVPLVVDSKFRFTIQNVAFATVWVAVSCAAWRGYHYMEHHPDNAGPMCFWVAAYNFMYLPLPAAIGALTGRPWFGLAVGTGLFLFWVGLELFLLYGGFIFI